MGNNCGLTDEHESVGGNETCHFTRTNSTFETVAFSPGH